MKQLIGKTIEGVEKLESGVVKLTLDEGFALVKLVALPSELESDDETADADAGADAADRQPYVVFCSDDTGLETLREAAIALASDDDPAAPGPGVLYWHPPKGRSVDTPLAKTLAASRYRASTTTRNLRTLAKIIAASP